jgi:hypothetical protein
MVCIFTRGWESNFRVAESKSDQFPYCFNTHSESPKFHPFERTTWRPGLRAQLGARVLVIASLQPIYISRHRPLKLISSWSSGSAFRTARSGAAGVIASGVPSASALSNACVPLVAPVTSNASIAIA